MAGVQAALILILRLVVPHHVTWPRTLMAVLAAALLAAGVLRHYWDIWIHRTVRGISFLFVGIDAAGDLFSLASVFFQPKLDVLGMAIYGVELALWLGVFACGGYYNLLPWMRAMWFSKAKVRGEDDSNRVDIPRSRNSGQVQHDGHHVGEGMSTGATPVMLHDMPSSTSVFRTASRELDWEGLRSRNRESSQGSRTDNEASAVP